MKYTPTKFYGNIVMHCHILEHEDNGNDDDGVPVPAAQQHVHVQLPGPARRDLRRGRRLP